MQLFILALLSLAVLSNPQLGDTAGVDTPAAPVVVQAMRHTSDVRIDGRLDEPAWAGAAVVTGFRQREPDEGAPATESTLVHVLYDDEAVYIGARLLDSAPDSITARLGRRDAHLEADLFTFFVDPYHDRRSGFYFAVNAAGTLYDGVLFNDEWDDDSWDGVWEGAAARDEHGWVAELRIPYSQLRFYRQEQYVWGVNFRRFVARRNEASYLVYTPRNESGFVSRFVDLVGIERIAPPRQVEVVPYVTARAEYTDQAPGNPFNDGARYRPGAGADVKVGLTSNLTLNATFNPDFGQVEVDPAVVNLSDFETFFPERRPFFIEGASIFNFGRGGARSHWGFNWGSPEFFYSRRIGRTPQGSLPSATFSDMPDGTPILGAAKVSGKVGNDLSVGAIQALTARAWADVRGGVDVDRVEVEPLTYYGVWRGQREFDEGRHALGFIGTTAARRFEQDRLADEINRRAEAFGLDGWTFLDKERTYVVSAWGGYSRVHGTTARLVDLQRSSQHYFQRPDADHVAVDSAATSLSGFAGRVLLNKQRGNVILNAAVGAISPGYNVNDVGFQWRNDLINGHLGAGYAWTEPGRYTRHVTLIGAGFRSLDFGGNTVWTGLWGMFDTQFLNYYTLHVRSAFNPGAINNRLTRGGPLVRSPRGWEGMLSAGTDTRKAWVLGVSTRTYQSEGGSNFEVEAEVSWKPAANVSVAVAPSLGWNWEDAQWVGAYTDPLAVSTFGKRYVFGEMDQVSLASSIRVNWTFSPALSFQLFAQPLVSAGDFRNYKELVRPRTYEFLRYGTGASTFDPETRSADPDGAGPAQPIELADRDFRIASLRGNAVLRWEYRPGSTLYLVWTQRRAYAEDDGRFRLRQSVTDLWDLRADNLFMVKLTFWLG